MAEWKSFTLEVPGKDILEPVRNVLETLLVFLEILKTILETIKAFLIDFGNPIRALVEALIKLIEELFAALAASGLFAYFDFPDPFNDPMFAKQYGGFGAFLNRFKGSLFDSRDFNRPQPRQGSTKSGFVLMVVDASDILDLIRLIQALMKFFGKGFELPQFEAPENVKAIPVGAAGDPILRLADAFTSADSLGAQLGPIEQIQIQWTLPTTVSSPDPGFSDVVTKLAFEFVPPSWVIEKTAKINPANEEIDLSEMGDPQATGRVRYDRQTKFQLGPGGVSTAQPVTVRDVLKDNKNEDVIKFQEYIVVGAATQIFGQLGRFRYIDDDVEPGVQYFYRVRAFFGDLDVDDDNHLVSPVTDPQQLTPGFQAKTPFPVFEWPTSGDPVVMGKASPLVQATIGDDLGDFDAFEIARKTFLTAFSLDFHQPLDTDPETGKVLSKFDENGFPADEATLSSEVGRGSMLGLGDAVTGFVSGAPFNVLGSFNTVQESIERGGFGPTGPIKMPYQNLRVRFASARLAGIVVSAMLQNPGTVVEFRDLMRASVLPRGAIPAPAGRLEQAQDNMETVVKVFTETDDDGNVIPSEGVEGVPFGAETFFDGYTNVELRLNVLAVINFFKAFTLGGVPPDWVSIVPLRDIFPWAAQYLYDLLDKIQALLDAFNGLIQEIRNFIDLLIRKIDALEEFIQFLIDILNFIESLSFSVFLLNVGGLTGDAQSWVDAIDTATGNRPPNNPAGYSAGVGLGYVALDVGAFETAFGLIFGPTG